jgi:excinuclease ABC subunit C
MDLTEKVKILPNQPGVYRFLNSEGKIIYIGKAKNLKKRVSQYFVTPERLNAKTRVLVSKIAEMEHTVVESEEDAFLLENNLIKQYQPKYNILLKDDKSYPWICIKKEAFPRVFITRRYIKDGSLYFGPYSSALHAHHLIALIHSLFPLRTCNLALSKESIKGEKFKPGLNFHIKKCTAPCIGKISEEEYNMQIENIEHLLNGKTGELIRRIKTKMKEASEQMKFEEAQLYKEQFEALNTYYSKSLIVNPEIKNIDVFSIVFEKSYAFGNFMRINNGCITSSLNLEFKMNIEEEQADMLSHFITEIYDLLQNSSVKPTARKTINDSALNNKYTLNKEQGLPAPEIIVPFLPSSGLTKSNLHVPLRGDKLSLLQLSLKNANAFKFQKLKQEEIKDPDTNTPGKIINRAVIALQDSLHLKNLPLHIECFDNSNTQGTNPVGSCVVFKNGRPSKREYRHYNIKTVIGANDFASMIETVTRRYSRLVEENKPLPQLVLVDGGRGQLNSAYQALSDLGLEKTIELAGIAKRLEEILLPGDPVSNFLDKNSPALKLLMQLRDEAHRFGITHHRSKRTKAQTLSELSLIPGIGEATEQKLLRQYKSLKRIKETPLDELVAFAGRRIALALKTHFNL